MKFAICNELFADKALFEGFARAKAFGYQGIEIAPFTLAADREKPTDLSSRQRQQIRAEIEKLGLEMPGLHWLLAKTKGYHLTANEAQVRRQTADYLGDLARLCADLGGQLMVLGSPQQRQLPTGVDYQTGLERSVEVLDRLLPTLEKNQVVLALEPLGPEEVNFINTAAQAVDLIRQFQSPQLGLHLDVKAMSTESLGYAEIILNYRPWLVHFHANDPNRQGPGMGSVDYRPIAAALNQAEYDDWISVEVFDYSPGIDRLAGDSLEYLRKIFG